MRRARLLAAALLCISPHFLLAANDDLPDVNPLAREIFYDLFSEDFQNLRADVCSGCMRGCRDEASNEFTFTVEGGAGPLEFELGLPPGFDRSNCHDYCTRVLPGAFGYYADQQYPRLFRPGSEVAAALARRPITPDDVTSLLDFVVRQSQRDFKCYDGDGGAAASPGGVSPRAPSPAPPGHASRRPSRNRFSLLAPARWVRSTGSGREANDAQGLRLRITPGRERARPLDAFAAASAAAATNKVRGPQLSRILAPAETAAPPRRTLPKRLCLAVAGVKAPDDATANRWCSAPSLSVRKAFEAIVRSARPADTPAVGASRGVRGFAPVHP